MAGRGAIPTYDLDVRRRHGRSDEESSDLVHNNDYNGCQVDNLQMSITINPHRLLRVLLRGWTRQRVYGAAGRSVQHLRRQSIPSRCRWVQSDLEPGQPEFGDKLWGVRLTLLW